MRNAKLTMLMIILLILAMNVDTKTCLSFQKAVNCNHISASSVDSTIHNKCEGFIVPFQHTEILLTQVTMNVEPAFWMCMVPNYDFHVDCQYTVVNPTTTTQTVTIAFPFSTHDIYGDHEEFETIDITDGGSPIPYSVALNFSFYSIQQNGLYFRGQLINSPVHPLLSAAYDMAAIAPALYAEDFEMVAFWDLTLGPGEAKQIKVSFTHYSGFMCCYENKNRFVFDVTNAQYWNGPVEFTGTFLKTLEYVTISTSFIVQETEQYFLLTGTNCSQKIVVVVKPLPWVDLYPEVQRKIIELPNVSTQYPIIVSNNGSQFDVIELHAFPEFGIGGLVMGHIVPDHVFLDPGASTMVTLFVSGDCLTVSGDYQVFAMGNSQVNPLIADTVLTITTITEGWDITGNIFYPTPFPTFVPVPVEGAIVWANNNYVDTTNYSGEYELLNLPSGNYVVRPEKELDIRGAISAYDAALILQYGVGFINLSPYQMIAADVSGNGSVSVNDAALILKYGVRKINKFPVMSDTTHFWRFVPDSICYTPLNKDTTDYYGGILYGDVSGNWAISGANVALLGKAFYGKFDIRMEDISGEAAKKVILPVVLENGSDMVAMSFTLEYNSKILKALNASTTEISENWQIAYNIKEDLIQVALAGSKPITNTGAVVNLEFEVLVNEFGDVSSPLNISEIIINEGNLAVNIQSAKFTAGRQLSKEYALSQNYPNPFNAQTVIKYQLQKAGRVVLKIYNTLGQEVKTLVDEEKKAGYHSIVWDGKNHEGSGVSSGIYVYRIQAGDFVKVKKMLFVM